MKNSTKLYIKLGLILVMIASIFITAIVSCKDDPVTELWVSTAHVTNLYSTRLDNDNKTINIKLDDIATNANAAVLAAQNAVIVAQNAVIEAIAARVTIFEVGQNATADLALIDQKWDAKPRPYPWTSNTTLTVTSNATTEEQFGAYVKIISKGTYNFGDSPNEIQIECISVESMDTNGVYILEFSKGDTYVPVGAIRFNRTSVQTRSFVYNVGGGALNADTEDLWVRMKTTPANCTITFSLLIKRHLATSEHVSSSPGFPFN